MRVPAQAIDLLGDTQTVPGTQDPAVPHSQDLRIPGIQSQDGQGIFVVVGRIGDSPVDSPVLEDGLGDTHLVHGHTLAGRFEAAVAAGCCTIVIYGFLLAAICMSHKALRRAHHFCPFQTLFLTNHRP